MPAAGATLDQTEAVLTQQTLSPSQANDLATAALEACRAIGRTAAIAGVDRGSDLVALRCGADVDTHDAMAAQRIAFTALSTETPTILLAERARNDPSSQNLDAVGEPLLLGGVAPVLATDRSSARSASPVRVGRPMTTAAPRRPLC